MRRGNFMVAGVSGNAGGNPNADCFKQGFDLPQFTRKIILTDQQKVVRGGLFWFLRADDMIKQGSACKFVAKILGSSKTWGIDGDHGLVEFFCRRLADTFDIIAD